MLTKPLFLRGMDGGGNINEEILAAGHEKKKKRKGKKCVKGNKMCWEICTAQLLCARASFHRQHHLRPLPQLERRWGRCISTELMVPPLPVQAIIRKKDLVEGDLQLQGFPRKPQGCWPLRFHLLSPRSDLFSNYDSCNQAARIIFLQDGFALSPADCMEELGNACAAGWELRQQNLPHNCVCGEEGLCKLHCILGPEETFSVIYNTGTKLQLKKVTNWKCFPANPFLLGIARCASLAGLHFCCAMPPSLPKVSKINSILEVNIHGCCKAMALYGTAAPVWPSIPPGCHYLRIRTLPEGDSNQQTLSAREHSQRVGSHMPCGG